MNLKDLKRRAGILNEASPDELRAQMAANAEKYLSGRGSSLAGADVVGGAAPKPEAAARTALGKFGQQLGRIHGMAVRNGYRVDPKDMEALITISQELKKYEDFLGQGGSLRLKRQTESKLTDLQRRAGILNENYHLTSSSIEGFALKGTGGLGWVMDGKPPAPSNTEREQQRAGHIDVEIADLKRRAGITEFVPGKEFGGGNGGGEPEGVPMWQRLQTIARSAQGRGQIDQHQIEEIFRAAEILKGFDR